VKRLMVLATRNRGKVREIEALLADLDIEVFSLEAFPQMPEVIEDGKTFDENAAKKARAVAEATGKMALADDSGLEVDALNGAPGVLSARYSGDGATDAANNAKLLEELRGVPDDRRGCRFRCVMVLYHPSGRCLRTEGTCEGKIAPSPRGGYGFGYDPVFLLPDLGLTMAQLPPERKNRLSHRAMALEEMKRRLPGFLADIGDVAG